MERDEEFEKLEIYTNAMGKKGVCNERLDTEGERGKQKTVGTITREKETRRGRMVYQE